MQKKMNKKDSLKRNRDIYQSAQKISYHSERLYKSSDQLTDAQKKYSMAFCCGDNMSVCADTVLLNGSRKYKTLYEKKAFWRGVKNGKRGINGKSFSGK